MHVCCNYMFFLLQFVLFSTPQSFFLGLEKKKFFQTLENFCHGYELTEGIISHSEYLVGVHRQYNILDISCCLFIKRSS